MNPEKELKHNKRILALKEKERQDLDNYITRLIEKIIKLEDELRWEENKKR